MKVLIIKFGALGDVILATPAMRRIQAHHHGAVVTLLTQTGYAGLFQDGLGAGPLGVYATPRRGLINTLRLLSRLRVEGFSVLYDLQSNDRTGVLCALSGVPVRVGNHARFPYTHHPPSPDRGQCHPSERLNQVLAAAGLPAAVGPPGLPVSDALQARVDAWLATRGVGHAFVVMHAGSSARHTEKRWPGYAGLAVRLQQQHLQTVWIGGGEDRGVNQLAARATGIDATGEFSVTGLVALGRRARFAVCNDSAPMHILSCSGLPVFGLFGPTDWRRAHAWGQQERVIAAAHLRGSGADSVARITDIRLADVLESLRRAGVLAGSG